MIKKENSVIDRIRRQMIVATDPNDNNNTFYIIHDDLTVRVSDHCSNLWMWDSRYKDREERKYVSIVFEESDTYSDDNLVLYRGRNEPLVVEEYVYRISEGEQFSDEDIQKIVQAIKDMNYGDGEYVDSTGKMTYHKKRESKTNGEIEVNNIIMLKTFMSKCR